jgi:hypothetical protein
MISQGSNAIMGDSVELEKWQGETIVAMSASELAMIKIDSLPETGVYKVELRKLQDHRTSVVAEQQAEVADEPSSTFLKAGTARSGDEIESGRMDLRRGGMSH